MRLLRPTTQIQIQMVLVVQIVVQIMVIVIMVIVLLHFAHGNQVVRRGQFRIGQHHFGVVRQRVDRLVERRGVPGHHLRATQTVTLVKDLVQDDLLLKPVDVVGCFGRNQRILLANKAMLRLRHLLSVV